MSRTPRPAFTAGAVALAGVVVLVVASAATGRSQTAPKNTKEPSILYVSPIRVGTVLNGQAGSWDGTQPITFRYQWLRCNIDGQGCFNIANQVSLNYTTVGADAGHTIRFQVTASNKDGTASATSNATPEIPAGPGAPSEKSPPTISGDAVVGKTLTATTGTWVGTAPISYAFKWQTCTSSSACSDNGASGNTYTIPAAANGKRIRVKVIAKNAAGETAGLSDPTATVTTSGGNSNSVAVDTLVAGDKLVVDTVNFNPNPVTSRSTPIQVKIKITDTKGKLVRGAFVFFRSTPILTSTPTDAATDSNGTVIYTITPRSDFPLRTGLNVQFYVKAYRKGDPTLAGVAGTRLVQVATQG
jgi:hypothetical protein